MEYSKIAIRNSDITLINGDCLKVMSTMHSKGKKVDVVLTSPPYNTTFRKGAKDAYNSRYDGYDDGAKTNDEYIEWTLDLFNNFDSILMDNGCILYNMSYGSENTDLIWRTIGAIIEKTKFTVSDCITWKKKSAIPNNRSKNKLTRITEYVFVFCRKSEIKTFEANKKVVSRIERTGQANYENVFNFIEAKNNDSSCKLNKATFSSDLVMQLLEIYAKPGSTVFDPFMGTGTTATGCVRKDCNCIGSELSKEQYEYSVRRVEVEVFDEMDKVN